MNTSASATENSATPAAPQRSEMNDQATPALAAREPRKLLGMRPAIFAVVLTTLVLIVVGTGISLWRVSAKPQPFRLVGGLTFDSRSDWVETSGGISSLPLCIGTGGYADIRPGAPVVVYGADGTMVAVGSIVNGLNTAFDGVCDLTWGVESVPGGRGPYEYEISDRGRLPFTEEQARKGTFGAHIG